MYCHGLGLRIVGSFEDHDGFNGVMLGLEGSSYHFEFTRCQTHPVVPAPSLEDLLILETAIGRVGERRHRMVLWADDAATNVLLRSPAG